MNGSVNGFDWAIQELKAGSEISREGWNGKGMFLFLIDPYLTDQFRLIENNAMIFGTLSTYIALRTVDNKIVPWQPSQTDMLTSDWGYSR
jgi:hypothetical protein